MSLYKLIYHSSTTFKGPYTTSLSVTCFDFYVCVEREGGREGVGEREREREGEGEAF